MSVFEEFVSVQDSEIETEKVFVKYLTKIFYERQWSKMADLEYILFQLLQEYPNKIYQKLQLLRNDAELYNLWFHSSKKLLTNRRRKVLSKTASEKIKKLEI